MSMMPTNENGCLCPCHTGGAMHFMQCACYLRERLYKEMDLEDTEKK